MRKQVDYIIVGQGMAGSCLALQLLKQKKKILVIDRPEKNVSTRIAAGLFNPITGKVMSKTWKADLLFPYLHTFYTEAEQTTEAEFFHPMPLFRPFISIEEQNEWTAGTADSRLKEFIKAVYTEPVFSEEVYNPLGGLLLDQCGYINTWDFCEAVRKTVEVHAIFQHADFNEDMLHVFSNHVTYELYEAKAVIFCNGVHANESKFFNWLPIRPLKGETLTIQPAISTSVIYNRGVYVVPDIWKVGATYSNQDKVPEITESARMELTKKLNELIRFPYKIIHQEWGMRPTTPDRRPILGRHPKYAPLIIFNGLGTKGVSLAPYFSGVLVGWLENGGSLNNEVDINRYIGNLLR